MHVTSLAVDIEVIESLAPLATEDHRPLLTDGRAPGGQANTGGEE